MILEGCTPWRMILFYGSSTLSRTGTNDQFFVGFSMLLRPPVERSQSLNAWTTASSAQLVFTAMIPVAREIEIWLAILGSKLVGWRGERRDEAPDARSRLQTGRNRAF
jgi:hypothetical protein